MMAGNVIMHIRFLHCAMKTPSVCSVIARRPLHVTTMACLPQVGDDPIRNFDGFNYPNQKYTFEHNKMPKELLAKEYSYPVWHDTMGIKWPGYWVTVKGKRGRKRFVYVKEMEPELIVPDLTGFDLKPYVSYSTDTVNQEKFTAKVLFNYVYAQGIIDNFEKNEEIKATVSLEDIDKARLAALQTGADLFEEPAYEDVNH